MSEKYAIRFALGAIKAVGIGAMEEMVKERNSGGKFKDIYHLAERIEPRLINKKSIEALSKAGAFDKIHSNRRQIAESFEVISAYSAEQNLAKTSNQMTFFGGGIVENKKPQLKKVADWEEEEKLRHEFTAFGFFPKQHPLDRVKEDLQKRGVIFSSRLDREDLKDGDIVKMAGVVTASRHRSGGRGRFAYVYLSDTDGVYETTIFDEGIITNARDLINDGSQIVVENLLKIDEGGVRNLVKKITSLDDFLKNTKARATVFEDIVNNKSNYKSFNNNKNFTKNNNLNNNFQANKINNPAPETSQEPLAQKTMTIEIAINAPQAIVALSSFLENRTFNPSNLSVLEKITSNNLQKITIFLKIINHQNTARIALNQQYQLSIEEIKILKNLQGITEIKKINNLTS